jgi:hypothetical protein
VIANQDKSTVHNYLLSDGRCSWPLIFHHSSEMTKKEVYDFFFCIAMNKVLFVSISSSGFFNNLTGFFHAFKYDHEIYCSVASALSLKKLGNIIVDTGEEFKTNLYQFLQSSKEDYSMIVPLDEEMVYFLNNEVDKSLISPIFPIADLKARDKVHTPTVFYDVCDQVCIRTQTIHNFYDKPFSVEAAEGLTYPVVVKKPASKPNYNSHRCQKQTDLVQYLAIVGSEDVLIEEASNGIGVKLNLYVIRGILQYYKPHLTEHYNSNAVPAAKRARHFEASTIEKIKEVVAALNLHGFAAANFTYDSELKRFYLLNIDARPETALNVFNDFF